MQTSLPELDDRSRELLENWGIELNPGHPLSSKLPPGWCWVSGNLSNDRCLQDPHGYYRASYHGRLFVFPCRYRIVTNVKNVKQDRETCFDYRYSIVQDRALDLKNVARFKGFSFFKLNSEWTAIQEDGGIYGLRDGEFKLLCERTEVPVTKKQSLAGFDPTQEWKTAYDRLVFREATELCDRKNSEANWEVVEPLVTENMVLNPK